MASGVRQGLENPSESAEIIPIRLEGEGNPIFCVPGHDGILSGIRRLAAGLDSVRVWAFPLAASVASARVTGLGAEMAACLERVQPKGPVRLVGVCFGGLVAFEAACCLQERGREVELLAMVDTLNPAWRRSSSSLLVAGAFARMGAGRLVRHLQALEKMRTEDRLLYLRSRLRALRETISDELGAGHVTRAAPPESRLLYRRAQSAYAPARPYTGRALLFEMEARRLPAPLLGWSGLLHPDTVVHSLPFDTRGSLSEITAPLVADALVRELRIGGHSA